MHDLIDYLVLGAAGVIGAHIGWYKLWRRQS